VSAFEESLIASIDEIAHACHDIADTADQIREQGEPIVADIEHTKTLRDEFAMAALATIEPDHVGFMADRAYQIADAMLAARKAKATDAKIAEALADAAQARVEGMKK